MTTFGPAIPHVPGKPCPFPDAVGTVHYRDGFWSPHGEDRLDTWYWGELGNATVTQYRIPANHHAYGPRISRMDREPDETVLIRPCGDVASMRVHVYLKHPT